MNHLRSCSHSLHVNAYIVQMFNLHVWPFSLHMKIMIILRSDCGGGCVSSLFIVYFFIIVYRERHKQLSMSVDWLRISVTVFFLLRNKLNDGGGGEYRLVQKYLLSFRQK